MEEALSSGWIDSTARKLDEDRYAQRFTPRRPGSPYSAANVERLRAMARRGKVAKDVLEKVGDLLKVEPLRPSRPISLRRSGADRETWKNFRAFSEPYKRSASAISREPATGPSNSRSACGISSRRRKRNRLIGYGGIQKHY